MTDDREWGSDMQDMGPGDMPEPGPDEPELIGNDEESEQGVTRADEPSEGGKPEGGEAQEHRSFRQAAAETVAKAVGYAVELGSVLGGQAGEIVSAERDVVEAEAEDLIEGEDDEDR